MRNAFRARGRGRTTLFATVIGVVHRARVRRAVLAGVLGHRAHGRPRRAARGAGAGHEHDRVRKPGGARGQQRGGPRRLARERIPARAAGVAARAGGGARRWPTPSPTRSAALFLLPVLIAATPVWHLGAAGWPVAIAISLLVQIAISMLAYAVQTRGGPLRAAPRRRRMVWTGLRLVAALSLATLWMLGTWVMRAPAALATKVAAPSASVAVVLARRCWSSAPLAALARGEPGRHARDAAVAGRRGRAARCWLAVAVARRAGMAGWEEAGAVWAEASPRAARRRRALADRGDQGPAPDRARSLAAAGADRDAGDLHRRADLRRRGLELDDRQPGARSRVSRISLALYMAHHRPAHAHAGRAARVLDPAHGAGAARQPAGGEGARLGGHHRRHRGGGVRGDVAVAAERLDRRPAGRRPAGHGGRRRDRASSPWRWPAAAPTSPTRPTPPSARPRSTRTCCVGGLFNLVLVEDAATRVAGLAAVRVRGLDVLAGGRRAGRLLPGRRGGARAARARGRRRDDADRLRARRQRAAQRRQEHGLARPGARDAEAAAARC